MVGYKLCRNCEYGCARLAIVQRGFNTIFTDDKIELYTINKSIKKSTTSNGGALCLFLRNSEFHFLPSFWCWLHLVFIYHSLWVDK